MPPFSPVQHSFEELPKYPGLLSLWPSLSGELTGMPVIGDEVCLLKMPHASPMGIESCCYPTVFFSFSISLAKKEGSRDSESLTQLHLQTPRFSCTLAGFFKALEMKPPTGRFQWPRELLTSVFRYCQFLVLDSLKLLVFNCSRSLCASMIESFMNSLPCDAAVCFLNLLLYV